MNEPKEIPRYLWITAAVVVAILVMAWLLSALGGLLSVWVWSVGIQLLVPTIGLIGLIIAAVHAVRHRTWSLAHGAIVLVALVAMWPLLWGFNVFPMPYPASLDEQEPAVTVRLPMNGNVVVLWGGDDLDTNYHAMFPDQRWAYDLAVEPVLVQSDKLDDYGCWGKVVVSPAAGTVVETRNDLEDHTPGELSGDIAHALGNHVALKLEETGTYVYLAHLQKGSVEVSEGDQVKPGDRLGKCGNSGNTSEPHVHVHHQRQSPEHYTVGMAEGLPLFFEGHDGDRMPAGGVEMRDGKPYYNGAVVTHGSR